MSTSTESVPDSPSPPSSPDHFINPIPPQQSQQPPLSTDNSPSPLPSFFVASSSSLRVGWYYIIETLADSKADLPLLKELVNRVPNFYTDAPESVHVRVALRYLEECASRGIVDTKDNTAGAIDISQPTVDFLCHNLKRPTDPCQPSGSRIAPVAITLDSLFHGRDQHCQNPLFIC